MVCVSSFVLIEIWLQLLKNIGKKTKLRTRGPREGLWLVTRDPSCCLNDCGFVIAKQGVGI